MLDNICNRCSHYQASAALNPNLPPIGSDSPTVYVVGEKPTNADDQKGIPWSGAFRSLVIEQLKKNYTGRAVRFYHAVNCAGKASPKKKELEYCSVRVRDELEKFKPDKIIACGNEALRGLFPRGPAEVNNMMITRGLIIPYMYSNGTYGQVLSTHPLNMIISDKGDMFKRTFAADIKKLFDNDIIEFNIELQSTKFPEDKIIYCKKLADVKEMIERLKVEKEVAFDFETTGLQLFDSEEAKPDIESVAFAFADGTAYSVPLRKGYWSAQVRSSIVVSIAHWWDNIEADKISHTKYELHCLLARIGVKNAKPAGEWHDTALMSTILDERRGVSKLKVAGWSHFGYDNWSVDVKKVATLDLASLLEYNARDSLRTFELYKKLKPRIYNDECYKSVYENVLLPASLVFSKVEHRGVPINLAKLDEIATKVKKQIEIVLKELIEESGRPDFNPGSNLQLREYFFRQCQYEPLKSGVQGESTNAETMKHFATEYDDKLAQLVLEFRELKKLDSTYVSGLRKKVFSDERLHSLYNVVGAVTGRTSSNEPNMQNFPKRRNAHVREMIIPPPGYKFVACDYGQIEARLFGVISGDETFCKFLNDGSDIHLEVSKMCFGEAKAKEFRQVSKNGVFAMLYGATDWSVAKTIGVDVEIVKLLRREFFHNFKRFEQWSKWIKKFYKETGYVESLFGRRRRYPMTENELLNHVCQSTASDMTLAAMSELGKKFDVALMVHDDLSFFIKDDDDFAASVDLIVKGMLSIPWLMIGASPYTRAWVPFAVEVSVGDDWYNLKDYSTKNAIDLGITNLDESIIAANEVKLACVA